MTETPQGEAAALEPPLTQDQVDGMDDMGELAPAHFVADALAGAAGNP